ncbi:MarR family transcriptional regulator [Sulfuracidifex metallicus]|uniref:MarR family transcriptional regulator n=1 Tax=Sulfuracidifex metallicus TaxID=47303 RepID=UPI0022742897|nr:MarR family transcriptional regulator [Sulfuracidifex metallicus]MCY0850002.1 MarR family transcriptional regulator [Sulfuracidifex metallicus]
MNSTRWKILVTLLEEGDINITKLAKKCSVRYDVLKREVDFLERREIVEVISGDGVRAKIIRVNYSNPKVILLKDLIEEVKDILE